MTGVLLLVQTRLDGCREVADDLLVGVVERGPLPDVGHGEDAVGQHDAQFVRIARRGDRCEVGRQMEVEDSAQRIEFGHIRSLALVEILGRFERLVDVGQRGVEIIVDVISVGGRQREGVHFRRLLSARSGHFGVGTDHVGVDGHLGSHGQHLAVGGEVVDARHGIGQILDAGDGRFGGHRGGRLLIEEIAGVEQQRCDKDVCYLFHSV